MDVGELLFQDAQSDVSLQSAELFRQRLNVGPGDQLLLGFRSALVEVVGQAFHTQPSQQTVAADIHITDVDSVSGKNQAHVINHFDFAVFDVEHLFVEEIVFQQNLVCRQRPDIGGKILDIHHDLALVKGAHQV